MIPHFPTSWQKASANRFLSSTGEADTSEESEKSWREEEELQKSMHTQEGK